MLIIVLLFNLNWRNSSIFCSSIGLTPLQETCVEYWLCYAKEKNLENSEKEFFASKTLLLSNATMLLVTLAKVEINLN
jgi:hypothetical protein